MPRIPVFVFGLDAISQAGLAAQLRGRPEVLLVETPERADVALVVLDRLDEAALRAARAVQRNGCPKLVLVLSVIEEQDLLLTVELGVAGLLRRGEATPEGLVESLAIAARGEASLPSDLLQRMMNQFKRVNDHVLAPANIHLSGLDTRETDVLRLIADGHHTKEIADELCYSERTIKNIVQDVTRRFGLRNRSHAVAYAVRQGLI